MEGVHVTRIRATTKWSRIQRHSNKKINVLVWTSRNQWHTNEDWTSSRGGATMQTSPCRVFRIPIPRFLKYGIPNKVHGGCSHAVNTSNIDCTQSITGSSDNCGHIWYDWWLSGKWLKKGREINSSYNETSIWKENNMFFKNGVDIPCLATSHTNNRVYVNHSHDENLKNNDNKVIWSVLDKVEEGPLIQCTTARYCRGNTRQRKYHEPCGYWEWYAYLRKKLIIMLCLHE